jgi:hypothetical protein
MADLALRYRSVIFQANALPMAGQPWLFAVGIHGKGFWPGADRYQCRSASAVVIGHCFFQEKKEFFINNFKR